MKKKLNLLIVAILSLIITGCSSADSPNTDQNKHNSPSTEEAQPNNTNTQQSSDHKPQGKTYDVTIDRVIDGDTVKINMPNGSTETIRLLLIDTPETVHPSKPVQPVGKEASNLAKELLPPKSKATLEIDVSERDKYGRLLGYLWIDGKMINEILLEKGYARVAYVYAPNTRWVDYFRDIQKKAQQNKLGIWSIEDYATDKGFNEEVTPPTTPPISDNKSCSKPTIKGNVSSSGDKIYHMPGQAFYDRTKEEEMFCTEEEAIKAGYRKSKR